jgi:hypothetical protein
MACPASWLLVQAGMNEQEKRAQQLRFILPPRAAAASRSLPWSSPCTSLGRADGLSFSRIAWNIT